MGGIERGQDLRMLRHFGEDRMAGSDLGQVHVRFEADRLEGLEPLGGEGVVEVLGHRIGVDCEPLAVDPGGGEARIAETRPDPRHELAGHRASLYLLAELRLFVGWKDAIHPGQERTEGEAHRGVPEGARDGDG